LEADVEILKKEEKKMAADQKRELRQAKKK